MTEEQIFPALRQVVLDCLSARRSAESYRHLLGYEYRSGDEPVADGKPDPRGQGWLVLENPAGGTKLAFQQVAVLPEATWPDGPHPQMLHLDLTVATIEQLDAQHARDRPWRSAAPGPVIRSRRTVAGLCRPRGASLCLFVVASPATAPV